MGFFPFSRRRATGKGKLLALNTLVGTVDPTSPVFAADFERDGFPEGVEPALEAARQNATETSPEDAALQAKAVQDWQRLTASPSLHGDETGTLMVQTAKQCFDLSKDFSPRLAEAALMTIALYADRMCYRTDLGYAKPDLGTRTTFLIFAATEAHKRQFTSIENLALKNLIEVTKESIVIENGKPYVHNVEIYSALTSAAEETNVSPKLSKVAEDLLAGVYIDKMETTPTPHELKSSSIAPEPE